MQEKARCSTGFPNYDQVVDDLRLGDNVVWHTDRLEDYVAFARVFAEQAVADGRMVLYMRFAAHPPILDASMGVRVIQLHAASGFESFASEVHRTIEAAGLEAFYVFDSLSELQETWATDLMVGNFFAVTCPYLFELDTIAYFCLIRGIHAAEAVTRIRETTQLFLNIMHAGKGIVFQPVKVWERYSPTMFLPHMEKEGLLVPVTDGLYHGWSLTRPIAATMDYWDKLFLAAENTLANTSDPAVTDPIRKRFCRLLLGHDEQILALAERYLQLGDLLEIRHRMVGTGYIGGKAVGMLLARKIAAGIDSHGVIGVDLQSDSLYIGSDVFQTFLIHNNIWRMHTRQQYEDGYYDLADTLRDRILQGVFPPFIRIQFQQALDMFGQTPVIVRSSSLLEDGYGNAFAGKYQSVFCVNQGDPDARLAMFEDAVRTVYASTVDISALVYRRERGLDKMGEQMSILVQRVSGSMRGRYHFPLAAGVGLSYSAYVWHQEMNPSDGMVRIVAGLGTRAVDRTDGDYTRVVSLGMPDNIPGTGLERSIGQRMVDVLDTELNQWRTIPLSHACQSATVQEAGLVFGRDAAAEQRAREVGLKLDAVHVADFSGLFHRTAFIAAMKAMLRGLEEAYQNPVDVEFTVNLYNGRLYVSIVQCRPLQTFRAADTAMPANVSPDTVLFRLHAGSFVGGGTADQIINTVVLLKPEAYVAVGNAERYTVARMLGRLNDRLRADRNRQSMLIVPGRCGTTTPSLGVPVRFSEINAYRCICEQEYATSGMIPELSFGSHFFQDLVESRIFYGALMQRGPGEFNPHLLLQRENVLLTILPEAEAYRDMIHVAAFETPLWLVSSPKDQQAVCWLKGGILP